MAKKTKIKNMTPHGVNIINEGGKVLMTFPSEGQIRLSTHTERCGEIGGIPLSKTTFGECELPEERDGVYYIVSNLVCQANPDRADLLIVNETVRDGDGRIIGCRSLSLNPYYRGSSGGDA